MNPHHANSHSSEGNLKVAFFLNLGFTIIEIVGGLWTNSIAILTDALHDSGDCASLGLAWYFEKLSRRGRTPRYTYGYTRYRLLGGLITGLVLIAGLAFILWKAIARLMSPEAVNAPGMMILAVIGILVNGAAVLRVKRGSSLTEKVVSWHLLEDTLGWGAVLIGAGVMAIWDVPIIDPILSIGISLFVLWNVGRNLTKVMKVFLQNTPSSFDLQEFEKQVKLFPKVERPHHIHVWSLDGESHVMSLHLQMNSGTSREEIVATKHKVRKALDEEEFEHVTIDVELAGEDCASCEEESV
ncbi:MAG: cation transporter [Planctomycetes bacterium]|nr:cation transporter [Planctomycetota bacterium]